MPNFVDIALTAAEIWQFFDFYKMAAVRHLGFVMCVLGPRTKAFGGLYHCAKVGWNRCSSFDNMHVFSISSLAWKRLFTPPKLGVSGCFYPLNGELCFKKYPIGTSLLELASFEPSYVKIRRRVWPVGEFLKKGYNRMNKYNFGYISPMCPEAPRGSMCI